MGRSIGLVVQWVELADGSVGWSRGLFYWTGFIDCLTDLGWWIGWSGWLVYWVHLKGCFSGLVQ